jgi:hypothetical protein
MAALKPSEYDTRSKSRKQPPLQLEQLVAFVTGVAAVSEDLVELMNKMSAIHIEPKKRAVEKVRELQQRVADLEAKKGS